MQAQEQEKSYFDSCTRACVLKSTDSCAFTCVCIASVNQTLIVKYQAKHKFVLILTNRVQQLPLSSLKKTRMVFHQFITQLREEI